MYPGARRALGNCRHQSPVASVQSVQSVQSPVTESPISVWTDMPQPDGEPCSKRVLHGVAVHDASATFCLVPVDVLREHLAPLVSVKELTRLMCVSKKQSAVFSVPSIWQAKGRLVQLFRTEHHMPSYTVDCFVMGYALYTLFKDIGGNMPEKSAQLQHLRLMAPPGYMRHLPDSISLLTNLRTLCICEFNDVNSLPEGISCLTDLERLELTSMCRFACLPDMTCFGSSLRRLYLAGLPRVHHLPVSISCLTGLTELCLMRSSPRFESVPQGISCLTSLQKLVLSSLPLARLPTGISCLTSLQKLVLSSLPLARLPTGISCLTGLTHLDLHDCTELAELPDGISCLTGLTHMDLHDCTELAELPDGISCLTGRELPRSAR